ncbi:MAG: homoserine dehydrogenase [Pseudomonadota bacterium]
MTSLIKIGLCGLGTVGTGVCSVLQRNRDEIAARVGAELQVTHIGARRDNPNFDSSAYRVSRDIFDVANDPEIDVLVELIGGIAVAKELITTAILNGKHVVTANKALIAEHGNELLALAKEHNVTVLFEAAVAGGIPVLKALREGLSANKVTWLAGIINGTGNFILSEMRDKGRAFDDVLAEAQALGYAEADPTFDVEGIDAAHKLMILASMAFGMKMKFDEVFTEGISAIELQDIHYAEELGYRIKHLGIARRISDDEIEVRVHPTLLPDSSLIANVNGVMNAVMVNGDAVGSTLYYGAGAGSEPTASAVIADLVDVVRQTQAGIDHVIPSVGYTQLTAKGIVPIERVRSEYYLRITAQDQPGALASITQCLSDQAISVEAMIQKDEKREDKFPSVILLTSKTVEENLNKALVNIEALPTVNGSVIRIRVDTLDAS